jgi:hypothetical protein
VPGGFEEASVFRARDLARGEIEGIDPNAMHGFFVVAAGGAAHLEPAFGDAHEGEIRRHRRRREPDRGTLSLKVC